MHIIDTNRFGPPSGGYVKEKASFLYVLVTLLLSGCFIDNSDPQPGNYLIEGPQDLYPSFSPDGNFVAYFHDAWDATMSPGYPTGLYIVGKDGQNRKLIIEGAIQSPTWSPTGKWLAFSNNGSLYKCTITGDSVTRLDALDSISNPGLFFPSWSKYGNLIVFDKASNPGYGIYVVSEDFENVDPLFDLLIAGRDAELSADGKFVLYIRGGEGAEHLQIFKAGIDSKKEIQLTANKDDNRAPTWSPSGAQIAWSANLEIYIMDSDGTNQTKIGYGNSPSWSSLNEIVVSHANEDFTKEVLYIMTLDGARVQITR